MNKNFLRIVEKEKPDYIFLWLIYEEFCPETLIKIRQVSPKTKIINFFGDDDTQFETFTRYFSLLIDYLLCFPQKRKKDYQKEKIKNVFFTRMVNTNVFKPLNVNKKYDITFVGTPKSDRAELLYYLKKKGIKIRIFGAGWERYPEFKEAYLGRLNNEDFIKVINQSKINLCLSKNYLNKLHVKGRIFNVSACKSFALLEYFKDYYKFFSKDEIVMFKDKEDLLNKIRYYLKNEEEREKIAERAYKKVIKKYNLEVELGNFFNKVYSERDIPPKTNLPNMDGRVLSLGIENLNSRYIAEKLKD
ncbi:MAG: glycosyltransferase, partial [Candidatus Pacearchaeota archaeon]